jgi:diguanylate cyclase (GGDEF)-like protein
METLAYRLTSLSSSEVALLLVALQYAVLAPAWAVAALVLPSDRRAAGWWCAYAAGSALGLLLIVGGMHQGDVVLRACGNVLVVVATLALQRGVWSFTDQPRWNLTQAVLALATLVLALLAMDQAWVSARIAGLSALWAGLYLWTAVDVWRHVRNGLRQRWGALCASPLLLAALMLGARSVRALQAPQTVMMEVQSNTVLSVGSSLIGLVAALVLQMMLVSLLVSRLVGRLDRLSRHDPLTGLLNRRAMDELLALEEQRVRRLSEPGAGRHATAPTVRLAVLMIDIDHFKLLNDSQGHAVGDRALQHLAAVMAAQLRDIDHLARWGGEEFLALLPATGAAEAVALAERLCERARSLPLVTDDGRIALTISVGVADWLGVHDSHADLLRRADAALYCAKREGRDQVRRGGLTALEAVQAA